jgi:hypothetical protein
MKKALGLIGLLSVLALTSWYSTAEAYFTPACTNVQGYSCDPETQPTVSCWYPDPTIYPDRGYWATCYCSGTWQCPTPEGARCLAYPHLCAPPPPPPPSVD